MSKPMRVARLAVVLATLASAAAGAVPPGPAEIASLDLSHPFAARSPWRLSATQGPPMASGSTASGDSEPGEITLCLRRTAASPCDPVLSSALRAEDGAEDSFPRPHYLQRAQVVHGAADRPLLLVRTASEHAGNGSQLVLTQVLAYSRASDRFVRAYSHGVGTNNNDEVRFIEKGPLKGDIISVEPTSDAPYGYWVVVNVPSARGAYRQALRYRSATHYGDGNALAVIDSEMPNILKRLGLWRTGMPLPLPASPCAKPHLVRGELWCK